jgi:ABC-type transport system substrate-binding protein
VSACNQNNYIINDDKYYTKGEILKTFFDKKYYLISMCLISLLASTAFVTALHIPIVQQQPPNPTRGPKIDKLRFPVINDVSVPPPNETLYVDEFTADYVDWTVYGDSPYLDAIEDVNYIEATEDGAMIAWFGFENITLDGAEIKKVVLEGYTDGPYNTAVDYDIYANDFTHWLGSLYGTGTWTWVTPRWTDETVDQLYPAVLTEEGLNSLQILVYFYDPGWYGGAGNFIDCLRLKVWYQEWPSVFDTRVADMQDRTIDVLTDLVRPSDIEKLDSECFTITSAPGFHICHFGFNIRPDQSYRGRPEVGPFLSDVNFRHALIHLYNQEEIISSLFGYAATPIRSLVPPALGVWHNPAVPAHPFNPDTAIAILESAGYYYDAGIDNWRNATGYPVPEIRIFSPNLSPFSSEHVERFVDDCNDIGLTTIVAWPTDFAIYYDLVFNEADFDAYMLCWSLGRFPDHLYDLCHSSQISPAGSNAPGINDPELDSLVETVMYSLDHEAKLAACHEIQERLYDESYSYAFAYINMYSKVSFNAFNPGLRGIVNSPGFGSDNMWTFLNMHWEQGHPDERIEDGNSTVIWCLADEPETPNPLSASTVYTWEILNQIYDPLMAINPYNHIDLPWLADSWEMVETPGGMNVTFWLNSTAEWQDGNPYTAEDAKFNWLFLRDNQIPRYTPTWEHIVDVEVLTPGTGGVVRAILDVTSQFLIYDLASTAALLPPPVWSWLNGRPLDEILAYDPSTNTTTPTGAGPRFGTEWCPTQLYGTGPFVFDYYDIVDMAAEMTANRYYFKTTDEIQAELVEMFWACGDVNRDGVVDQTDRDRVEAAYGCVRGEPCYDPDCDFNSDGIIDIFDLSIVDYFMGKRREYPAEIVDVAILDVKAFPTVVLPGQQVNITVTAKNKENAGFTTNFTYYYNDTFTGNQTVTNLIPCHNTTIEYVWDTTGVSPGVYTISVNATVLDGVDVNLTDNTFIDGTVLVTILGDIDGDGDVDPADFYIFSGAYGTSPPSDPRCDLDHDGDVDPADFYIFSGNYGKTI